MNSLIATARLARPRLSLAIIRSAAVLIAAAAAISLASAARAQPTITNLGVLPGETTSFGFVVNSNGTAVGGQSAGGHSVFRWTAGGGLANLGSLPGAIGQQCLAINADGSVLAGYSALPGFDTRAFRWTSAGGMENLGGLPGAGLSGAFGLSADGLHVVGHAETAAGDTHAVRWHAGGIEDLGTLPGGSFSEAYSISADTSTITGLSDRHLRHAAGGQCLLRRHVPRQPVERDGGVVGRSFARGAGGSGFMGRDMGVGHLER